MNRTCTAALCLAGLLTAQARAQTAQSADEPLRLAALQSDAIAADPRGREFALQHDQTELRLRNLEVEHLPTVSAAAQSQFQSDVPHPPSLAPGGPPLFAPPKDTYDVSARLDQKVLDPALRPRMALARAELAESQARLRVSMFDLKEEVNEAFFTAAVLQEQIGALGATLTDLESRLRETSARVREGTALASDAAAIEAALLAERQQDDELRTARRVALARLSRLSGRTIRDDVVLALPELGDLVTQARAHLDAVRARPEYEQFDKARDRAARQEDVSAAAERPQVSAFGRAGFGRPGLNFISDQVAPYAIGGVQLQWKAWTWGTAAREREALARQDDVIDAEEAAFTARVRRTIESDVAAIDRLERALAADDRIIELRAAVDRTARARFREAAATASESLERTTEWLGAQFTRARHRVELAHAQARLLTTLGLEVR